MCLLNWNVAYPYFAGINLQCSTVSKIVCELAVFSCGLIRTQLTRQLSLDSSGEAVSINDTSSSRVHKSWFPDTFKASVDTNSVNIM